jgi:hypothetical protein
LDDPHWDRKSGDGEALLSYYETVKVDGWFRLAFPIKPSGGQHRSNQAKYNRTFLSKAHKLPILDLKWVLLLPYSRHNCGHFCFRRIKMPILCREGLAQSLSIPLDST